MDVGALIENLIVKPAPGALVLFALVKGVGALWTNASKSKELGFSKEKLLNDGILSLVAATQAQVLRIEEECKELRMLLESSQNQAKHETGLREAAEVLVESHFAAKKIAEDALSTLRGQYHDALLKIDGLQRDLSQKTNESEQQQETLNGLYVQVSDLQTRIHKLESYISNHNLEVPEDD